VGFQQSGENVTGIGPVLEDVFPVPEAAIFNDRSDGDPPLFNLALRGEIVYPLVGRRDHGNRSIHIMDVPYSPTVISGPVLFLGRWPRFHENDRELLRALMTGAGRPGDQ
jgi:hypothetical protein